MKSLKKYLAVSAEVQEALKERRPVVALESTIISHGMPYPQNVETALSVEKIIRENGAIPATIAILGGKLTVGCSPEQIEYLGKKGLAVTKASRRDLPVLLSRGEDGATTVTTTMIGAALAGIRVFATGGIGGVHRGAETTMDISADARIPGDPRRSGDRLRNGGTAGLLYPEIRVQGGLQAGYAEGNCRRVPGEAGLRPAGRHAGNQSNSGGVLHGSGLYQQEYRRGH